MSKVEALLIHLSTWLVIVSGLIWGWMLYFCVPQDAYSLVNHPWQPHLQALHILLAPFMIFAIALVFKSHVLVKLKKIACRRRVSGLQLLLLLPIMVVSGYLLQVLTGEQSRQIALFAHLASTVWWILAWLRHHCFRVKTM